MEGQKKNPALQEGDFAKIVPGLRPFSRCKGPDIEFIDFLREVADRWEQEEREGAAEAWRASQYI